MHNNINSCIIYNYNLITNIGTTKLKRRNKYKNQSHDSDDSIYDELYGSIDQCTCPHDTLFDIQSINTQIHQHFIVNKSESNLILPPQSNRFHRMQCHSLAELYNLNSYSTDSNNNTNQRFTTLKYTRHVSTPPSKILSLFIRQCQVKNSKLLKSQAKQYGCILHGNISIKTIKHGSKGGGMKLGKLMYKLNKKMNRDKCGNKRTTNTRRKSDSQPRGSKSRASTRNNTSNDTYESQQSSSQSARPIDDSNIGNRMLRLLGWNGTAGLGKSSNPGIITPILPTLKFNKRGVGTI